MRQEGAAHQPPPTLESHMLLFLSLLEKEDQKKGGRTWRVRELGAEHIDASAASSEDVESEVNWREGAVI